MHCLMARHDSYSCCYLLIRSLPVLYELLKCTSLWIKASAAETVKHVFLACSRYNTERQRLGIQMAEIGVQVFSISSLFGHSEKHQLISKAVLQFLHETGMYRKV